MSRKNHNTNEKNGASKIEIKPYPGILPESSIVPEKLKLATTLLRTVKNLKGTLEKFRKSSREVIHASKQH